jgi:hypothetical protein
MTDIKAKLTADRVSGRTMPLEIPDVGTIVIRALSRHEMMESGRRFDGDPLAQERYILSRAIVDPELAEHDIAAWQKGSAPGEINEVAKAVNAMSGIGPDAAKEQYKSLREGSEPGV